MMAMSAHDSHRHWLPKAAVGVGGVGDDEAGDEVEGEEVEGEEVSVTAVLLVGVCRLGCVWIDGTGCDCNHRVKLVGGDAK